MSKLGQLDREQLERLHRERLIKLILVLQLQYGAQQELVQQLQQQVDVQRELIQKLQDQLAKDGHYSGKPPSSDGPKKGKRMSLHRSGQRPRGGQRGHEGPTLKQVAEPDHVIVRELAARRRRCLFSGGITGGLPRKREATCGRTAILAILAREVNRRTERNDLRWHIRDRGLAWS